MKKLSTTMMACALTLALPMSALAAEPSDTMLIAPHQDNQVTITQKEIKLEPKVIKGVTMVPARAVFEALGFTITWNEKEQTIHAENGERNGCCDRARPVYCL
ncbi:copper amine oxidase N-terminal domain-containing protein [Gorillibacterium timonense]|uniref:copper amine oxidase N-terminal domain-containing protein n=1 Tax=Gorillibacterium timonense TaxID=1689269 RepID=UPI00071D6396|nr:copper amine oxidase N-terminal domain-containing protein [Gorillibacterium timonense]